MIGDTPGSPTPETAPLVVIPDASRTSSPVCNGFATFIFSSAPAVVSLTLGIVSLIEECSPESRVYIQALGIAGCVTGPFSILTSLCACGCRTTRTDCIAKLSILGLGGGIIGTGLNIITLVRLNGC